MPKDDHFWLELWCKGPDGHDGRGSPGGPGSPCGAPGTGGPSRPRFLSNLFHLRICCYFVQFSLTLYQCSSSNSCAMHILHHCYSWIHLGWERAMMYSLTTVHIPHPETKAPRLRHFDINTEIWNMNFILQNRLSHLCCTSPTNHLGARSPGSPSVFFRRSHAFFTTRRRRGTYLWAVFNVVRFPTWLKVTS